MDKESENKNKLPVLRRKRSAASKEIVESLSNVPKVRSPAELMARYNLKRQEYQELRMLSDNSPEKREQLAMIYAEAKVLGWALGKSEKEVIGEVHGAKNDVK